MATTEERERSKALHEYDETYLECRDLRHAWSIAGFYNEGGEVRRLLRCRRCPTERIDRWDRSGDRIASAYDHPDDYHLGLGVGQYDVRREVLRRVQVFPSRNAMVEALSKARKPRTLRAANGG